MLLPIQRVESMSLECPCCGKRFVATKEHTKCPKCEADIEICASENYADGRITKSGGEKHKGPGEVWLVAFCKDKDKIGR